MNAATKPRTSISWFLEPTARQVNSWTLYHGACCRSTATQATRITARRQHVRIGQDTVPNHLRKSFHAPQLKI
ncbi:hypothetical protein CGCVW01_v004190 [Colletotrichum viniferum]|nr:hypothetical protein CGCVW01_v004190 [Colletotrichum viniferum]